MYKNSLNKLKSDLDKIDLKINELSNERASLKQQINNLTTSEHVKKFNEWNIDVGSCLICIDKLNDLCNKVRTIKVTSIHLEEQYIRNCTGTYLINHTDTVFNCTSGWISFSSLFQLEHCFNIYLVSEEKFNEVLAYLANLKLTREDKGAFEEYVSNYAYKSIKTS